MKIEKHLSKFKRIEDSISKLDDHMDWELIVEGLYGMALHLIAAYCEKKYDKHMDKHSGLIGFLKDLREFELANLFQRLDELRMGNWYGGRVNGETSEKAREVLDDLKKIAGKVVFSE